MAETNSVLPPDKVHEAKISMSKRKQWVESFHLGRRNSAFQKGGGIDIYAECAAVDLGNFDCKERLKGRPEGRGFSVDCSIKNSHRAKYPWYPSPKEGGI